QSLDLLPAVFCIKNKAESVGEILKVPRGNPWKKQGKYLRGRYSRDYRMEKQSNALAAACKEVSPPFDQTRPWADFAPGANSGQILLTGFVRTGVSEGLRFLLPPFLGTSGENKPALSAYRTESRASVKTCSVHLSRTLDGI